MDGKDTNHPQERGCLWREKHGKGEVQRKWKGGVSNLPVEFYFFKNYC